MRLTTLTPNLSPRSDHASSTTSTPLRPMMDADAPNAAMRTTQRWMSDGPESASFSLMMFMVPALSRVRPSDTASRRPPWRVP